MRIEKKSARIRRAARLRYKLRSLGSIRLVVHRSLRHIYAQVIAPESSRVIVTASTLEKRFFTKKTSSNKKAAAIVGRVVAERAIKKGVKKVSFDRSGFKYHGRVQALADAARKSGLCF